jgi:hypothetical protein
MLGPGRVDVVELRLLLVGSYETPSLPIDVVISGIPANNVAVCLPMAGEKSLHLSSGVSFRGCLEKRDSFICLSVNGGSELLDIPATGFEESTALMIDVPKPHVQFKSLSFGPR